MPGADRDEESGKYTQKYPTEEFLRAVEELEMPTAQDVADCVGCSYETAYKKLRSVEEDSTVTSKKVASVRVWLLADDE